MFQANIEGLQQLKDGTVKFTLTCPEDQLVTVSEYRKKGKVTVMGEGEAPATDSRITVLTNLHSVAVQIAEALDRELAQEVTDEEWNACHPEQMTIMGDFGPGLKILDDVAKERDGVKND